MSGNNNSNIEDGGGWIESIDPKSGRTFYANRYTRTTQWEAPPGWKSKSSIINNVAASANNNVGGGRNNSLSTTDSTSQQRGLLNNSNNGQNNVTTLPEGWEEMVDPNSGRTFYIDHLNQITTWERPRCTSGVNDDEGNKVTSDAPAANTERNYKQHSSSSSLQHQINQLQQYDQSNNNNTNDDDNYYNTASVMTLNQHGSHSYWDDNPRSGSRNNNNQRHQSYTSNNNHHHQGISSPGPPTPPQLDFTVLTIPNPLRQHCPSCSNPFSYTRRKHHCRLCGDIFCDACSNNRSILPLEGDEYDVPVRICDVCMRDVKRGNYFSLRRYLTCLELYVDVDEESDNGRKRKEDGAIEQQQMITLDMVAASLSSLLTDIEAMLLEPITSFSTKMTISANILVPAVARHLKRRKTGEYAVWVLATLLQLGNVVGDDSFALAMLGIVSEDVGGGGGGNGDDNDDGGVSGEEKMIKAESTGNIVLTVDQQQQQQQQQSSKSYVKNILKILEWNGNDIRTLSAQEQAVKMIYYITDPDLIANALSMKDSLQEEDEGPVDVDAVADAMKQDEKNEEFIHIDIHRAFRSMLDHAMSSDSPSLQRWATACLSHLIAEDQRRACRVEHSSSSSSSPKKKYESFTSQLVSTGGVMILCSLLNSDDGETRAHATSALEAIVIATREIGLALQPSSPKKGRGFSRVGRGTENDSAIVDAIISNVGGSSLPALAHLLISADESVSMMGCSFILSLISPLLTDPRGSGRALQQCSNSSTSSGVGFSFEVKEDGLSSYRNAAIALVVGDDTVQGDVSCLPSLIAIVRSGVEDTSSWGGGSKARSLKVRAKAAECLAAVALAVGHVIGIHSEQSSYDSTYMKAKSALEVMEHERIFDVALQIITSDSHRSLDPSRDSPESRLREAAGLILLALSSSSIVSCSYLMSNGAVSTLLTITSESRMLNTPSSVRGKWASKGLCFLEAATTLLIRAWKTEQENGATSSSSSQSLNLLIETINSGAVEMASRLVKTKVTLKSHDLAYSQLRVKIAICFMLSSMFGIANNQNSDVGLSRLYSAIDADCAQFLATSGGEDIGVRADLVGATLNLLNATLPYAHQFTKEDTDEPLPMIDLSEACLLAVGSMCGLAAPIGAYSRLQRNNDINDGGKYSHIRLDACAMACNILTSMKPNQAALLPTVLVGVIGESLIVPTLRLSLAICQFGNDDVCGELSRSGMLVPVGDILQRALASSDCYTAMISVALIRFCGQCTVAASGTVETLKGAIQTLSSILTLPEIQNDTSLNRHRSMLNYESLVALEALSANDTLQSTIATVAIPALVSFLQQLESSHLQADEIENEDAVFIALVTIQKTTSVPSSSSIQSMLNNGIVSILVNIFEKREEVKNKRVQEVALQIIQSIAQSNMENRYWLTCSGVLRSILSMLGESKATAGTTYVGLNTAGLFLSDLKPSVLTQLEPSKKGELLQQYLNIFCSQRDFVRRLIATISDDCQAFGHPFVFPEDSGVARDIAADVLFHIFSLLLLHGQSSHFNDAIMLNDVSGNEMNVATACSALLDLFSDDETNSARAPSNPEDISYYSDVQLPTVKSHLIEALSTSLNQALSSSSKTDAERLIKKLKLPRTCLVLCRSDKLAESAFRLFEEVVLSLAIDFVGDLILCDRVALVTLFDLVTGQANKVPDLEHSKQTFAKLLGNLAKAGLLPKAVDSFGVRSHAIAALSAAILINGDDENIDDDEDSIQWICLESLAMVLRDEEDQIKLSFVESRALASALGKMLSSTILARFFTQANLETTINDATVDFGLNRSAICQSAEARLLCAMAHFPESLEIVSRVGGLEAVGLIAHEGEIGAVEAVMEACKMNPQLVVDVEAHLSIMDALVGTEHKLSPSSAKTNVDVVVKCLEIVTTLSVCDDTRESILNADQSGYCMKIASNIVTANAKLKCDSNFDAETTSETGADLAAKSLAEKLIATSIDDQDLQIGDPVLVDSTSSKSESSPKTKKVDENTHEELEGDIVFMGPVEFAPGDDWIGIHLTGSSIGKGRNNGSVKGVHYFDCEEKSGVFVKRTHVRKRAMDLKSKECDSVEILSLPEPAQQPTNPWEILPMGDNPRLEKASFALLQSFSRSKRHRDAMMNNNEFTTTLAAAVRSPSTTIDFKRDTLELFSSFTIHYCEPKEDLITLFCDVIESQTRTLQLSRDRQEQSSSKQLIGVVISGLQNLICGCQNAHDQTRSLRAASDLFTFLCNTLFSGPRSRRTTALKTDGALFATVTSLLLLSFGSEDVRKSIFTTQLISSLVRFIMMTSRVETMDCHVAFYNKDGEEYWEAANAQCLQILTYIVNMTTQVHLDTTFACLIGECEPSINSFSMCLQSISNRAHGGSSQVWARQLLAKLERLS